MDSVDPAEEWSALREHYSLLNDDALRAAASEAYTLTEIARFVLQSEIRTRGLDIKLKDAYAPPQGDPRELDLLAVCQVWSAAGARRVKDVLDAAFIPSYFGPKNLDSVDQLASGYESGVDVKVQDVDQQRAFRELNRSLSVDPGPDAEGEFVCPKCKSPEIVFCGLDNPAESEDRSIASSKFNWRCDVCGHHWQDDGIEQKA